jgi:hypothetical protein
MLSEPVTQRKTQKYIAKPTATIARVIALRMEDLVVKSQRDEHVNSWSVPVVLFSLLFPALALGATYTDSGQSLGTYSTTSVALGDVDGDGDVDAFTANEAVSGINRCWIRRSPRGCNGRLRPRR